MTRYIISDTHFGHYDPIKQRGIITFERNEFKTIQEHDDFVVKMIQDIARKIKPGDEFWHLGDFGNVQYLWLINLINEAGAKTHFIFGNHDSAANLYDFNCYFSYVHLYPIYVSNKLVFSHEPVGAWDSVLNVHGHLHGSVIDKPNYLNASIWVANYKPITDKHIAAAYSKMPKWCMRFLYEPYAQDYKFLQPKEDVIMDRNGKIDVSASRLLMKINQDNPHEYKGGLDG